MNAPAVSIVMAVHNGGKYLAECVQSILDQSYTDFEFIVVDDASTDGTWEILTTFGRQDARIVLLRNRANVGVVGSLNEGLERSRGGLIARQDADDRSHPERIRAQAAFLQAHADYGLVAAVPQAIAGDGRAMDLSIHRATSDEEIQVGLLDRMCLCGPSIMVRRSCLEAAGFYFSEGLDASEDYDLCLRLAEVTRLASLEGSLYLYRQHPESASSKRAQQQMYNKAIALERAVGRRYANEAPDAMVARVARDYLHAAVIAFARRDLDFARRGLQRALEVSPLLLDSPEPLESLVRAYTPAGSIEDALGYTRSIFEDLLPRTRKLGRMKSKLLSDLHMGEVFAGASRDQPWRVRAHLGRGIRHAPGWLLNRGVISIAVAGLFRRGARRTDPGS